MTKGFLPNQRNGTHRKLPRVYVLCMLVALLGCASNVAAVPPPGQPAAGPGGSDYRHASVTVKDFGQGGQRCWMFLPDAPQPKSAPVVVFVHGWGGINPGTYGAWIKHLARRGYIVIYPQYQDSMATRLPEMIPNALAATKKAIASLKKDGPVQPDSAGIAYVAHSIGGYIAANMAGLGRDDGLPPCKAIMVTAPANGSTWMRNEKRLMKLEGLDRIPADVLMVAMYAEEDRLAKDIGSRDILRGATRVSETNKALLMVQSDSHPDPALKADHFSPTAPDSSLVSGDIETDALKIESDEGDANVGADESRERPRDRLGRGDSQGGGREGVRGRLRDRLKERVAEKRGGGGVPGESKKSVTNALDYYGYWKVCDGMLDAAFRGQNRDAAFGGGDSVRYMGEYSDGQPVKPLVIKDLR